MSNQTIIERAMLKQYCQKQSEERAERGIKPSAKDVENKVENSRIALRFKVGFK